MNFPQLSFSWNCLCRDMKEVEQFHDSLTTTDSTIVPGLFLRLCCSNWFLLVSENFWTYLLSSFYRFNGGFLLLWAIIKTSFKSTLLSSRLSTTYLEPHFYINRKSGLYALFWVGLLYSIVVTNWQVWTTFYHWTR